MCEIDRAAIPQMCWSNLQPELVQQASPLKGLMQCQNLWLRGHPLFLPPQSDKSWISFPHYSFLFFLLLNSSAREAWDVNETFSLEERTILGQRQGRSWSEPMTSSPSLFFLSFLLFPAVTHCGMWKADWNQHCVRAVISQKDIKHAETSISNRPLTALRHRCRRGRDEGKVRTLGGCCTVEVSSSGFTETQERQDKVYQVIA